MSEVTEVKYPNCDVYIENVMLSNNLITLPFKGYDTILGIDWLSKHFTQVDRR